MSKVYTSYQFSKPVCKGYFLWWWDEFHLFRADLLPQMRHHVWGSWIFAGDNHYTDNCWSADCDCSSLCLSPWLKESCSDLWSSQAGPVSIICAYTDEQQEQYWENWASLGDLCNITDPLQKSSKPHSIIGVPQISSTGESAQWLTLIAFSL